MKKQPKKIKKLELKKDTLTSLQLATGGSRLYDTVYRPSPTEYQCPTHGCGYA